MPTASRLVTYEKISARISRGRWSMDVVAGVDAPGTKSVDSFGRFGVDILAWGGMNCQIGRVSKLGLEWTKFSFE